MVEQTKAGSSTALGERKAVRAAAGKYLTFKLTGEEYGLEILKVQEIIGMMHVTAIPRTPDWVRGVINLRGKVIPVIDLRTKFAMQAKGDDERTCIIVVQIGGEWGQVTMGTLVDEVSEVLDIVDDQIEAAPSFGKAVKTDFILGMGKVNDKVVTLLDIDGVLTKGEYDVVSKATNCSAAEKTKDGAKLQAKQKKGEKEEKS